MDSSSKPNLSGRLRFIDGLRGIAAFYVVIFHINFRATSPIASVLQKMPAPLWWFVMHGNLGVDIFFVLSGFVIARSLRRDFVTPTLLARFAARRSLRLDLPYWAVIALVVSLKWTLNVIHPNQSWFAGPKLSTVDLLANFLYLQNFFQRTNVLAVSWTLCLELVFYLTYIMILAFSQRISKRDENRSSSQPSTLALFVCFIPTLLFSFWCFYVKSFGIKTDSHNGIHLYFSYWHLFLVGAILQWVIEGWISQTWLMITLIAILPLSIYQSWFNHSVELAGVCGALTALAIFAAAKFNRMDLWLSNRPIQLAGKMSYSIYLIHVPICMMVLGAAHKTFGLTTKAALIGIPMVLILTAGASLVLYWLIERPSLNLSKKIPVHTPKPDHTMISAESSPLI